MGLTFEPLGKYVRLVDERNTDMVTESVLGINIDKYFMPSVANVIGTDLSNYKLLRKGRFACNPMHVGRDGRLPVSRYTEDAPAIVSPAYFMFEIIDENKIEPEYLMLCFRRPDFDRMCWFRTDASVRGGITWDDVCALTIPVPTISEQRKIVHDYQVITDRIALLRKINENLEDTMESVFKSFVSEKGQDDCETVYKALKVINGTAFSSDYFNTDMNGYPLVRIRDLSACNPDVYTSEVLPGIEYVNAGDILVGMDGEFIPHVWYGSTGVLNQRVCKIVPVKQTIHPMFLFWTLKPILAEIQRTQGGTTVIHIGKKDFDKMVCAHMTEDEHKNFYEKVDPMFKLLVLNYKEILKLSSMVTMIQSSMSIIS